ncbi:hypothetical protein H696_01612 [Fonticula alba]|uniref:Uncharacterized protein n=1 Tax=Fonticula alba TaxID=691883 RepID=A0A058ZFF7_FONAL|nr:hypothetical protein H696_01612 [Fonticula alba]KCV72212.1 hypothetical protein H696_01612 [Fonticula alba]|eukprot:XP_009493790.1 hypothetical protein H696_01612 [Fonticula alba]
MSLDRLLTFLFGAAVAASGSGSGSDPRCTVDRSTGDFVLGILLFFGTIISFAPQHWRLIAKRSHIGLSYSKVILGTFTATCGVGYYSILEFHNAFRCCTDSFTCFDNLLNFLQLVAIYACDLFILFLYIWFFDFRGLKSTGVNVRREWRITLWVMAALIAYMIAVFTTVAVLAWAFDIYGPAAQTIGSILVLGSAIGQLTQWCPQIYTTWKLKSIGSLSLPMVLLQCIGSAITAYFISTVSPPMLWMPFLIATFLTAIIFVEGGYFWWRERRLGEAGNADLTQPLNAHSAEGSPSDEFSPSPDGGAGASPAHGSLAQAVGGINTADGDLVAAGGTAGGPATGLDFSASITDSLLSRSCRSCGQYIADIESVLDNKLLCASCRAAGHGPGGSKPTSLHQHPSYVSHPSYGSITITAQTSLSMQSQPSLDPAEDSDDAAPAGDSQVPEDIPMTPTSAASSQAAGQQQQQQQQPAQSPAASPRLGHRFRRLSDTDLGPDDSRDVGSIFPAS